MGDYLSPEAVATHIARTVQSALTLRSQPDAVTNASAFLNPELTNPR